MANTFETLMAEAEALGRHLNTDWAYEHAGLYDGLEEKVTRAYRSGEITSEQAICICSTGFYDYDSDIFED